MSLAYLYDTARKIIVAEGSPHGIAEKVEILDEIVRGRYIAMSAGDARPEDIEAWREYTASEPDTTRWRMS